MATVITFISQKGGVGKSTLARALAVSCVQEGIKVLLADLDHAQQTTYKWAQRRTTKPAIVCQVFVSYQQALHAAQTYQLMIIDGPAFISQMTLAIAQDSLFVIQPIKPYLDDLEPAVLEFNALQAAGIPSQKLLFVLNQVLNANSEQAARLYLTSTPFPVLQNSLPARASYPLAQNLGLAITEISSRTLKDKTNQFMKALINKITSDE